MDKETKLRSVLFFVIGFLLVLSLLICIYIVAGESKLVPVEATVVNVTKDAGGVGIDNVEISYTVDGSVYGTYFDSKKDLKNGDKINVYYYSNDYTQVKYSKTSKLIFLCPVVGLVLCALGIFELYRRRNDGEDEFKTSVIGVVGNTQQLKIVTENTDTQEYEPTPEEQVEVEVKTINKPVEEEIPQQIEVAPTYEEAEQVPVEMEMPAVAEPVAEPIPEPVPETEPVTEPETEPEPEPEEEVKPVTDITNVEEIPQEEKEEEEEETEKSNDIEDVLIEKVKQKGADKIVSEDELKEAIKDVLVDVIKEVKKEKKTKEIVQVRVIPNYYYISGTSLMYEEAGKEQKELNLKDVKNVTRTINEAGNVVKLVVESPEVKCILTNMKNIDLEQLSNLLRNKMRAMDENFEEVIEHKEY
ncbi:MAG: hypothetical protein II625_02995 [Bacilli bacterium]|nr:hypothetical protein [Bacilli bacterium]